MLNTSIYWGITKSAWEVGGGAKVDGGVVRRSRSPHLKTQLTRLAT